MQGKELDIRILRHPRARKIKIVIRPGGEIVLTVPGRASLRSGMSFLSVNAAWVISRYEQQIQKGAEREISPQEYGLLKKKTRELVLRKLSELNAHYGFRWNGISVRNQRTRWGSCSRSGNLSFNCRLALLPERLAEYIIVHELCHLGQFNHGPRFWELVGRVVPEYRELKRRLNGLSLK